MGRGMSGVGFFPGIFKTENQQIAALSGVICAAGTLYYIAFNLSGAPRTSPPLSPLCAARTAPTERAPSRPGTPELPPPLLAREGRLPPAPQSRTSCRAPSRRSGSRQPCPHPTLTPTRALTLTLTLTFTLTLTLTLTLTFALTPTLTLTGASQVPRGAEPGPDQRAALGGSFIPRPLCT